MVIIILFMGIIEISLYSWINLRFITVGISFVGAFNFILALLLKVL